MSSFFRIKSKPKINVGRRETSKIVSSNNSEVKNQNAEENQEEQLGKALEQQLSQKCEDNKEITTFPNQDAIENPTSLPIRLHDLPENQSGDTADKPPESSPNKLIEKQPEPSTKTFFRVKSKPKINIRREISFKNDSVEKDQTAEKIEDNEVDQTQLKNVVDSSDTERPIQIEEKLGNDSENHALKNQEDKSTSNQKVFFRVKSKPKFNARSKILQDNKIETETVVNEVLVEDEQDSDQNQIDKETNTETDGQLLEENVVKASENISVVHSSKSFFRVKSKPKISSKREIVSKTIPIENDHFEFDSVSDNTGASVVKDTQKLDNEFQAPIPVELVEVNNLEARVESQIQAVNLNNNDLRIESQENQLSTQAAAQASILSNNIDRPLPPPSPTKINRIKAVPRFSESDGSRHHGRIRNISVCSVTSTAAEGTTDHLASKEVLPIIQKKINRTEQSRKLTEARKEFQKRFGLKSPDKQKLKMIDLIFYNPTTNPMTEQKETKPFLKMEKIEKKAADEEEEEVDDPSEEDEKNEKKSEDEKKAPDDEMPVPQIKIGPNGEIILDEQSLVIENKDIQKQKDDLQRSDVVDGDLKTGYGVFKRAPRSKDWTHKETLRFYKALNVIGTDFSLMAELFPNRNRRELKMKFKKEEKINGSLIGKAITMPCCYNYEQIQDDFRKEQEEENELRKIAQEEANARHERKLYRKEKKNQESIETDIKPKKPRKSYGSGGQLRISSKETISDTSSSEEEEAVKKVIQKDDKMVEDEANESEEEAAQSILQPTRSGRLPKSKNVEQALLVSMSSPQLPEERLSEDDKMTEGVLPTRSGRLPKSEDAEQALLVSVPPPQLPGARVSEDDQMAVDEGSESEEEAALPILLPTRSGRLPKSKNAEQTLLASMPPPQLPGARVSDDYEMAEDEESESEEEATMPILLPTRSGRLPKSRNIEQALLVSMPPPQLPGARILPRSRRSSSVSSTVSNESSLENAVPGSIMVMTEDGPDGKPVYKSYMVTPERSLTPLNVDSEVIAKVIDYKHTEAADLDDREDNNVTIPAGDSVLDLRTNVNSEESDDWESSNVTLPTSDNVLDLRTNLNSENEKSNFIVTNLGYSVLRTKTTSVNENYEVYTINEGDKGTEESQI